MKTARPGSEIFHVLAPDEPQPEMLAAWSLELLRSAEYSQRWLQWAKTEDAEHGRPPEVARFPWEPQPERGGYDADPMTLQEALDFAGWTAEMNQ